MGRDGERTLICLLAAQLAMERGKSSVTAVIGGAIRFSAKVFWSAEACIRFPHCIARSQAARIKGHQFLSCNRSSESGRVRKAEASFCTPNRPHDHSITLLPLGADSLVSRGERNGEECMMGGMGLLGEPQEGDQHAGQKDGRGTSRPRVASEQRLVRDQIVSFVTVPTNLSINGNAAGNETCQPSAED